MYICICREGGIDIDIDMHMDMDMDIDVYVYIWGDFFFSGRYRYGYRYTPVFLKATGCVPRWASGVFLFFFLKNDIAGFFGHADF